MRNSFFSRPRRLRGGWCGCVFRRRDSHHLDDGDRVRTNGSNQTHSASDLRRPHRQFRRQEDRHQHFRLHHQDQETALFAAYHQRQLFLLQYLRR